MLCFHMLQVCHQLLVAAAVLVLQVPGQLQEGRQCRRARVPSVSGRGVSKASTSVRAGARLQCSALHTPERENEQRLALQQPCMRRAGYPTAAQCRKLQLHLPPASGASPLNLP